MKYIFKIFRFDPLKDASPFFEEFSYETEEKKSVLEALMDIRNEQDCTLAFRYSCREAICGSCAMVINGQFDLACRTMVESLGSHVITIEPLPNLEIQKDLVVDMEPFWQALHAITPFLIPEESVGSGFSLSSRGFLDTGLSPGQPSGELGVFTRGQVIEEKEMEKIEQYIGCILCGSCYSACPVVSRDERYLGPAALAKLYRFVRDPRDKRPFAEWSGVNTDSGVWGCDTVFKCNDVCPKNVRPADGIESLRRKLIVEKLKRFFRLRR